MAAAAIAVPAATRAGQNFGAYARLSWSLTDTTATDVSGEDRTVSLFLHVERAGDVTFKGAEMDLSWYPDDGCITRVGGPMFVSADGYDCAALNRDTTISVLGPESPGHLHLAWANPAAAYGCEAGAVLRVDFALDDCEETPACFVLNSLQLLDELNETDVCGLLGWKATVNGSAEACVSMNHAPVLSPIGPRSVHAGQILYFPVTGIDPDCTLPTYGAIGLPPGAVMAERSFTWVPAEDQVGDHPVTFFARDAQGAADSEVVVVSVTAPYVDCRFKPSPLFTCGGDVTEYAGNVATFTVCVDDWDVDSLRTRIEGMPPGAQFDGHTFTWQTAEGDEGAYSLTVYARDRCREISQARTLTVLPARCPGNTPPVAADTTYAIVEGDAVSIVLPIADPEGRPLTVSRIQGPFPAGLSFSDGRVTGTPQRGSAGLYDLAVTATDDCEAQTTARFPLVVRAAVRVMYVDGTSPCSACDGTSWPTAYHTVDEARLASGVIDTVRIAAGEYAVDQVVLSRPTTLLGAYAPGGGRRDPGRYVTTLRATNATATQLPPVRCSGTTSLLEDITVAGVRGREQAMLVYGSTVLRRVRITDCAGLTAAVITIGEWSNVTMESCTIDHVSPSSGATAPVYVAPSASLHLRGSTVVTAPTAGWMFAGAVGVNGRADIVSSILWTTSSPPRSLVANRSGGVATTFYSDVRGGAPGATNIDADPRFCDADGADFRLATDSPCARAGEDGVAMGAFTGACADSAHVQPPPPGGPPAPVPIAAPALAVCPSVARTGVDVRVDLPANMSAEAAVFDMQGARVCTLPLTANGTACTARWDLLDRAGRRVAAGLYVVRALAGGDVRTQRVYVTR